MYAKVFKQVYVISEFTCSGVMANLQDGCGAVMTVNTGVGWIEFIMYNICFMEINFFH